MPLKSLALASVAALVLGLASPARAGSPVDDSALRYYAAHNEIDRYEAELKRLRMLYPDWTPPARFADEGTDPEAELWALYAADDLDGLAAAIAAREAADAAFAPSADLSDKIALKTARRDLLAADEAGDAARVLALAADRGDLGGCADLDAAWRIAAARLAVDGPQAAAADYRGLLQACDDVEARIASVQKALALLGPAATRPLVALARRDGDDGARFAAIATDVTRAEIAAALSDPAEPAPDPVELAAFGKTVLAAGPAADAALLGWWQRREGHHEAALVAFETAATLAGADAAALPKITEGIVLSLDALGRRDEAVARARDGRARSADLAALYVALGAARFEGDPRPKLPDGEIADYAAAVTDLASAPGAEALGWYAHDFHQYAIAGRWFDYALQNGGGEGAARGLVLAALAAGDRAGALRLRSEWQDRFPDIAALDLPKAAPGKPAKGGGNALQARFERQDWRGCVALAESRGRLTAAESLTKGWCLLELDRPAEAAVAFEAATRGSGKVRDDAVYGRSLALFAAGDVRGATASAAAPGMTAERRTEVGVAVLAEQAIAAFNARRWSQVLAVLDTRAAHVAETRDLAMMRGWALAHLRRKGEAARVFAALDQTLSTGETRAALAALRPASR